MSKVALQGNSSGAGTITIQSPNTANNRTLTLPDATTTLVGTDNAQTLTNKTIQGGCLALMEAQASTSGFAINFTNIPAWVKRITVTYDGLSTSGTSNILLRIGDSGGIEIAGYQAGALVQSNIFVTSTDGIPINGANVAAAGLRFGSITLIKHMDNTWIASGTSFDTSNTWAVPIAGRKTLTDVLDRIQITTANGTDTFDGGTVNILYEG